MENELDMLESNADFEVEIPVAAETPRPEGVRKSESARFGFVEASFIQETQDRSDDLFVEEEKSSPLSKLPGKDEEPDLEAETRRDPEEEYFRLSVLSLKMQYNEKDLDFVF